MFSVVMTLGVDVVLAFIIVGLPLFAVEGVVIGIFSGASNWIESISAAEYVSCFIREPSPMAIVNLPPAKLTIRPLRMLPSLSLIVSAKAASDIVRISAAEIEILKILELNDIFPPADAKQRP